MPMLFNLYMEGYFFTVILCLTILWLNPVSTLLILPHNMIRLYFCFTVVLLICSICGAKRTTCYRIFCHPVLGFLCPTAPPCSSRWSFQLLFLFFIVSKGKITTAAPATMLKNVKNDRKKVNAYYEFTMSSSYKKRWIVADQSIHLVVKIDLGIS